MSKEKFIELCKSLKCELLIWIKFLLNPIRYWIYIPSLCGVLSVYALGITNEDKASNESLAIVIMATVSLIALISLIKNQKYIDKVLTGVAIAFLCREIHFYGTHQGVYIVVALIAIWAFIKNKQIFLELERFKFLKLSFSGIIFSYFIALLIQRRGLRHILPNEDTLHIPLEEVTENIAHSFFLLTVIISLIVGKYIKKEIVDEK